MFCPNISLRQLCRIFFLRFIVYTSPYYFLKGTTLESRAINTFKGFKGWPPGTSTGENMGLFLAAIRKVMREYKPDGLYFDGQYTRNPAALYALDHHVDRVADDHANARRLAEGIRPIDEVRLDPDRVDTNMVFFRVDPAWGTAREFSDQLRERGLLMLPTAPTKIRAVTHLDVDGADLLIGSNWHPFIGLLDEVKIYRRVLTAKEIEASYEKEKRKRASAEYELVE